MEIRYVGVTGVGRHRLSQHIYAAKAKLRKALEPNQNERWISELLAAGLKPVLHLLDYGEGETWQAAEKLWIAFFRSRNYRLTNMSEGGEGTPQVFMRESTREKLLRSLRGRKLSPAHRAALYSAESRAKISARGKGRIVSDDTRRKMSDVRYGKTHSAESKEKVAAAKRGKPRSDATRLKCSLALIGRKNGPMSQETKLKISAAVKGKTLGRRYPNRASPNSRHAK